MKMVLFLRNHLKQEDIDCAKPGRQTGSNWLHIQEESKVLSERLSINC